MKKSLSVFLILALLCAALSGCGAKKEPAETPAPVPSQTPAATPAAPTPTPVPTVTPAPEPTPLPEALPGLGDRPAASGSDLNMWEQRVDSVEALLDAIAPYAEVVLAPGDYDLALDMTDEEIGEFNSRHGCVTLYRGEAGIEIAVRNCAGLTIRGDDAGSAGVRLTSAAGGATVLNFEKCAGLTISHLTAGHAPERGAGEGCVLALYSCSGVLIDSVDLYGGVFGLKAVGCADGFTVRSSILRDCVSGPFSLYNCPGEALFVGCAMAGSDGGGEFEPAEQGGALRFVNCEFGREETNVWKDSEGAQFDGCVFGVLTQFPKA